MNQNELMEVSKNLTMEVISNRDFQKEIISLERKGKEIENLLKQVKESIKILMEQEGMTKIEGECMDISYTAPSVREDVDKKRILIEHPEFKEMYGIKSITSSYIKFKIK